MVESSSAAAWAWPPALTAAVSGQRASATRQACHSAERAPLAAMERQDAGLCARVTRDTTPGLVTYPCGPGSAAPSCRALPSRNARAPWPRTQSSIWQQPSIARVGAVSVPNEASRVAGEQRGAPKVETATLSRSNTNCAIPTTISHYLPTYHAELLHNPGSQWNMRWDAIK